MYKDEIVPHMELLHIWVDCSSDLLDPILEAWLKWELSNDEWSHIWLILDWSIVEEHMSISMYDFLLTHLCSVISIAVICHAWGIGLGLSSYSGISPHSWSELMGYICLIHWWLDCDCYGIFRWFLRCLYLFCGCLMVDVQVNLESGMPGSFSFSFVTWNLWGGSCEAWFLLLSSVSLSTSVISISPIGLTLRSLKIN